MSAFKSKGFKTMNCRDCKEPVEKVDANATAVVCWKCVSAFMKGNKFNCENEMNYDKDTKHDTASK